MEVSTLSPLQTRVNTRLEGYLTLNNVPSVLQSGLHYGLLGAGKRIRPALVYATNTLAGGDWADADAPACAIECIHAYSLIHDDLPALDNDDMRRGKPTVHKQFGEAAAILIGDALLPLAFEIITNTQHPQSAEMVKVLAKASGIHGMVSGQWRDIFDSHQVLSPEQIIQLHQEKTGALFGAALQLGFLSAHKMPPPAFTQLGLDIGLLYQIQDDLFDLTATPEQLGKATQKDKALGKNTFPTIFGLKGAEEYAQRLQEKIADQLSALGTEGALLREVVHCLIIRSH